MDSEAICRIIEGDGDGKMDNDNNNNNLKGVPLSALIWFAVRNANGNGDSNSNGDDGNSGREIESRIANALHLKEHQALRFYDELSRRLGGKPELVTKELFAALEAREKLRRRCERLEQKRDELIAEREKLRAEKTELVHELEELRRMNEQLRVRLREVEGEATDRGVEETKKALSFLRKELRRLSKENAELLKKSSCHFSFRAERRNVEQEEHTRIWDCSECNANTNTNAEKNDVIFCPVEINSHNACQMVKEECKMRNKPCYFLRSSGLSALKKVLSGFEPGYGKTYGE